MRTMMQAKAEAAEAIARGYGLKIREQGPGVYAVVDAQTHGQIGLVNLLTGEIARVDIGDGMLVEALLDHIASCKPSDLRRALIREAASGGGGHTAARPAPPKPLWRCDIILTELAADHTERRTHVETLKGMTREEVLARGTEYVERQVTMTPRTYWSLNPWIATSGR